MKKKMLALLVAVTLCMVLIAMPFSASAASSVSYTLNGYRCTGTLSMGQNSVQKAYATATTGFATQASEVTARATLRYGWGTSDSYYVTGPEGYASPGSYAASTATADHYSSVPLSATGTHHVSYGSGTWTDYTSI